MKQLVQKLIIITSLLISGLMPLSLPVTVSAAAGTAKTDVCQAIGSSDDCTSNPNGISISSIINLAINVLSVIVGIAAIIMIVVGGFRFVTSGGEGGKVASAKSTVAYALVGLIVAASAQFIVRFVLGRVGAPK